MGEATDREKAMLDEWRRERDELDSLISGLEKRIAQRSGPGAAPASSGVISSDEFFRLSTPEAIKKFLKIVGKPARSTQDIIDGLKIGGMESNYTNVYTALVRLQKRDGVIAKVGENWGLEEWYPRAPREKPLSELATPDLIGQAEDLAQTVNEEPAAPTQAENQHKGQGRKQEMADFIRTHGPSTRTEILAGSGIPEGTFAYCVRDTKLFVQGEDGKWRNVE
jgi:hypothetical protein